MSLPAELQSLLDQIDTTEQEARRLVDGLDDLQVNRQPDGGGWSVAQCLDHLARMNVFYVGAVMPPARDAAGRPNGSFAGLHPGWFGRWFINSMEPPVKRKMKAPTAEVTPPAEIPRDQLVSAFVDSHGPYRELVALAARTNPDRILVRNPFFRHVRMKLSTVLLIIPAHDRRHLWQASKNRVIVDRRIE
jgi:hypothetical protein